MKDNPEFNVQFVSIIEKHPLIYNYNSNDYSNRNLQDKGWEKISKELNESVHDCKERWKNVRGSYTRHLKYTNTPSGSAAKKKKPYYLAEHMTFLLPFTKSRATKSNIVTPSPVADADNSDSELDNTDELPYTQDEEQLESEVFSANTPDSSAVAGEVTRTSISAKVLKKSRVDPNKSGPTLDDVNKSAFEYFESKKASNQSTSSNRQKDEDPDVLFLLSLLPNIKKMNDNQKRNYKIQMLTCAGNILNETAESTSPPNKVPNTAGTNGFKAPPDNVQNTGGTNEYTLPTDNERTAEGLVNLNRVTTETDLNYLSQFLRFP